MVPKILFEDDSVLVIDKPSGMVVNRAESVVGETVFDWSEKYLKILNLKQSLRLRRKSEIRNKSQYTNQNVPNSSLEFRDYNLEFASRAGVVHRIDKETSGALLIAKTPEAFQELQRQFKDREIEKTYTALVHGIFEPASGVVNAPVGRLPWNRERFGILPGGRDAETTYKTIKVYDATFKVEAHKSNESKDLYSLVEFYPKTGRTHQIRVHAKYLNHPLVADTFYAGRKTSRNDRKWCPRLFLHASQISFTHPKSGNKVTIDAPLSQDLQSVLISLTPVS